MLAGEPRLHGDDVACGAVALSLVFGHCLLASEQARKEGVRRIDEPDNGILADLDCKVKMAVPVVDLCRLLHESRAVQYSEAHTQSPPSLNTTEQDKPTWLRDSVHGINRIIDGSVTALRQTDGTASESGTPANDNEPDRREAA